MKNHIYILFTFALFSCAALEEPPDSLVVEAYIYESRPIENIKITLVNSINIQSSEIAVSNAHVTIVSNNVSYRLSEFSGKPGYYYLENSISVVSGNTYKLIVKYEEIEMEGETTIPPAIRGLKSNKDTLNLYVPDDFLNITWNSEPNLWYLGVIRANDADKSDFPFNSFFSIPTQVPSIKITPNDVQEIGDQQFILYGITKEYEDLYRITNSSIGSSNAGNMTNGFGIFAGFSSDTLTFTANPE